MFHKGAGKPRGLDEDHAPLDPSSAARSSSTAHPEHALRLLSFLKTPAPSVWQLSTEKSAAP